MNDLEPVEFSIGAEHFQAVPYVSLAELDGLLQAIHGAGLAGAASEVSEAFDAFFRAVLGPGSFARFQQRFEDPNAKPPIDTATLIELINWLGRIYLQRAEEAAAVEIVAGLIASSPDGEPWPGP